VKPEPTEAEAARLNQLATELAASGADSKRRLPVVQERDAVMLTRALQEEIDGAVDARAQIAAAQGTHIACHRGCNACCHSVPVVLDGEIVTIAAWLRAPENAAVRADFLAAYGRWRSALGPALDEIEASAATRSREETVEVIGRAVHERRAMCAFNRAGDCTIYPVRPRVCRMAHALETSSRCGPDGVGGPPERLAWAPLEDLNERMLTLERGLHRALRPGGSYQALCAGVHRRLMASAETGRNDPCPCGSGKKFKKCCGQGA